ncbi:MAG: hypothetical protein R2806_10340 [Saprospiraceae bacterium]
MKETFKIFQLTAAEVDQIQHSENVPHTHDYEELLIGIKGRLEHFIDFECTKMEAPFASFVTKGKVHQVIPYLKDGECEIWALRFKSEFIPETTFQLYAHTTIMPTFRCLLTAVWMRMQTICRLIDEESRNRNLTIPSSDICLVHCLPWWKRNGKTGSGTNQSRANTKIQLSCKICSFSWKKISGVRKGVEFYAEKLFMSSRNLNIIYQNIL